LFEVGADFDVRPTIKYMQKINILGVNISNITFSEGVDIVRGWLTENNGKQYIVTPNPEFVMRAQKDTEFKQILNKADLAIPDGVGLIWAGKILGTSFKERVTGVDFMLGLCELAAKEGYTIGLLGGRDGVAEKTAKNLQGKLPNLKINFIGEEWNSRGVMHYAPTDKIDILFVAYGAPKQEKWIAENLNNLPVKVAMGVGGTFDYLAGKTLRAPKWMRQIGLEWLYRLICEPWRFRRQLAIWKFGFLILKHKLASKG